MKVPPSYRRPQPGDDRVLRIYIASHCATCRESERLAEVVATRLPDIAVDLVNTDHQKPEDEIFAVPTFCYRGKVLFLGNPAEDELVERIVCLSGS